MPERSFLFDSEFDPKTGKPDRAMNSTDFARIFKWFLGTGIVKGFGNELKVSAQGNNMRTVVKTGSAFIEGRPYSTDTDIVIVHDAADAKLVRQDLIVLRLDLSKGVRAINVKLKKGTLGRNTPPNLQLDDIFSGGIIYEIPLAVVTISPGKSFIDNSQIANQHDTGIYIDLMSISGMYLKQDDAAAIEIYNSGLVNGWYTYADSLYQPLRVVRDYNGMCTISGQLIGGLLGEQHYVGALPYWARPKKRVALSVIGGDGSPGFWYIETDGNIRQTAVTPNNNSGGVHVLSETYLGQGAVEVPGR
ncbi:hypothetical protein [Bacillus sp. FDAARGOS_235]|uniref:hypothetical protein n=1 Tax=Bacillus sp. FDAARGOS_235 TaxID=1839798 RepID=UPI00119F2CD4|nr:hypothetical protein [Bacillus sp. FDAARGOS_235]